MIQRIFPIVAPGMIVSATAALLGLGAACSQSSTPATTAAAQASSPKPPEPSVAAPPPAALVPPAPPAAPSPPRPPAGSLSDSVSDDDAATDGSATAPLVLAAADAWRGRRVHRDTAVLLFTPRLREGDSDAGRTFQPLVCSIAGKRAIGVRCGEAMPARATIRTPSGEIVVARSTRPFHDEAGQHDYPAPYGPACCTYNTCLGNTVPYTAARGTKAARDPHTIFAVWPADADIALEVATAGRVGVDANAVPALAPGQRVDQAFARGTRRFASIRRRDGGDVIWDAGAGWRTGASPSFGARGYTLLATTDVDHDGHLELISYQNWANDYGLDVFGDADPQPLYSFSCGNI